ncbi:MAG: hypothetical protein AB7N80_13635 [Bdellovibrionales bacterium]
MQTRISFIAFTVLFLCETIVAAPLSNLPGSIPLKDERQAASDLVYDGKVLQPDDARQLVKNRKVKDLSLLNPMTDSILWQDKFTDGVRDDLAELSLKEIDDEVEFVVEDPVPGNRACFIAQKRLPNGQIKSYRFWLDDKGHNILARKMLLRQIGYNVPLIAHIKTLRVKFKGAHSKRQFLDTHVKKRIFRDGTRWVASDPQTEDEYLTFQDLIAFEGTTDWFYNLATGNILPGVIQGRRLINSLLIPYALTDVMEDVETSSWTCSQKFNELVLFPYEYQDQFDPSWDDARWIMRRIMTLQREDWERIAKASSMPPEPGALYGEKMISCRDTYVRLLDMEKEAKQKEIGANRTISMGERLQGGKLLGGRRWPGYARNFTSDEPASPWSLKEIWAMIKSKALSNIISNTVAEFNLRYAPKTDLGFKIFDHQLDVAAKQFAEFLTTGKVSKTPLGVWKTPYHNSQIIAAREVVTGSYLGTENTIQLADTLGFAVEGGMFYLGEGLPTKMTASARAKVSLVMTYTHIKPFNLISPTLDEDLSNIIVPAHKNAAIEPLRKILAMEDRLRQTVEGESEDAKKERKKKLEAELKANFDELAKYLGPGESYLINTSLSPGFDLTIGRDLAENARTYLRLQERLAGVWRMHIHRKNETDVDVYIDRAGYNELSASLSFLLRIPILELGFKWLHSLPKTTQSYFYSFSLDSNLDKNPKFFDHVTAVAAALKGTEREFLNTIRKPWQFDHEISDFRKNFELLVWKNTKTSTTNRFKAIDPDGKSGDYLRRIRAERKGVEYEGLLVDVTNALLEEKHPGVKINTTRSGNPADTIYGKAVTRQAMVDARVLPAPIQLDNVFAAIGYRWKGWELKREGVLKVFDEIDRMFGAQFFKRPDLGETNKVQFYAIEIQMAFYRRAIENILKVSDAKVHDLFKRYARQIPSYGEGGNDNQVHPWATWLISDLRKMRTGMAIGDTNMLSDALVDVIEVAESQLEFDGFREFIGGQDNMFIQGSMKGFRQNSKNQKELRPETLGRIGAFEPLGPIYTLQKEVGISSGELLLHWLVNPL